MRKTMTTSSPDIRPQEPPLPPSPPIAGARLASGSLVAGFFLAWLVVVAGEILLLLYVTPLLDAVWLLLLPPLVTAACAIVLIFRGKSRTGTGLLLGLLSIAAIVLLLVAACFGILGQLGTNPH